MWGLNSSLLTQIRPVEGFERLYRAWGRWDAASLAGELNALFASAQ